MKKIVLVCGLISGFLFSVWMVIAMNMIYRSENFEGNAIVGYAAMILIFSLIFVGIKNYRDKYNNGVITFGKAFKIGLYIALIGSTMYMVTWLIDYYFFIPDFMDKYSACMIRQYKESGASTAELSKKTAEIEQFKEMYKNPLFVVLITYSEVLPAGLLVTLISALILKRKTPPKDEVIAKSFV
jgi:hypothetical protein